MGGMRGDVWEGGSRGKGYMYTYNWFTLIYSRNEHNIVKQLYSNKKKNQCSQWGNYKMNAKSDKIITLILNLLNFITVL